MSPRVNPTPGWPSRDILRAAAIVAAVYVALKLLWVGRSVFLLGFFGVLLGIVLSGGVDRLERVRIPRGIGAVLILLLFLGALTGIGFLAAPQISSQIGGTLDPAAGRRPRGHHPGAGGHDPGSPH
jgi:predicted PurR-regulated permease PerM